MTTRAEHIAWSKQRAFAYLDNGDVAQAYNSFISDMTKHPRTEKQSQMAAVLGMPILATGDVAQMRQFIEGFAE